MSAADNVSVMVMPGRNMRGVANLTTLDPDDGEPWGLNRKGQPAAASMIRRSLRRVIDARTKTHAHFVTYFIEDADGVFEKCPRLTKEVLGQVREAGADVRCWGIAIDLDLKDFPHVRDDSSIPRRPGGKVAWDALSPDHYKETIDVIERARGRLDEAGCPWNVYYSTAHGARTIVVFPMSTPAGPGYERVVRKVHELYQDAGLYPDPACGDWTRLYAVPRCTLEVKESSQGTDWRGQARRGQARPGSAGLGEAGERPSPSSDDDGEGSFVQTWLQDWFEIVEQWDDFYLPPGIDEDEEEAPVLRVVPVDAERPDDDEARALVEVLDAGSNKWKPTVEAKAAKKELALEPAVGSFASIFELAPLAAQGNRHTSLLGAVGEVIARIYGFPWASPELVYALLLRSAHELGQDDSGDLFVDRLWEMTTSFWAKEDAKAGARRAQKEEEIREKVEAPAVDQDEFARGVRRWLPGTEDMSAPAVIDLVRDEGLGVVFDQKRDNFHVLLPNGYYDTYPCSLACLRKVIEERGMAWLVPISFSKEDERGELVTVALKPETIRDDSARTFAYSEFTLRHGGSHLAVDEDGRGVFKQVPFWLREDLEPTKFDECYEWLRLLVQTDSERFMRAIACMLAIEHGPTAAVSLIGPKGTGKSMLGIGLGDCFNTKCVVPGDVLVAKHNDAMLWSPIVHIDEGIDKGSGGIDFANVFRRIVTGGAFSVEPKGMPRVRMVGAHRILMTANNLDTINSLGGRRARTSDDWGAISERVAHFHADEAAADYLARGDGKRRGLDWTRSWVGEGSEWKLARTLLWILHNELEWIDGHPVREGRRMLFEGSTDSDVMRDLEAEANGVPELVRAINKALGRAKNPAAVASKGRIYVTAERIVSLASEQSKLQPGDLRDALRSLLMSEQPNRRTTVEGLQQRWKVIDQEKFLELLDRIGESPAKMFSGVPA